jgi:uncharacterized protein YchJ
MKHSRELPITLSTNLAHRAAGLRRHRQLAYAKAQLGYMTRNVQPQRKVSKPNQQPGRRSASHLSGASSQDL